MFIRFGLYISVMAICSGADPSNRAVQPGDCPTVPVSTKGSLGHNPMPYDLCVKGAGREKGDRGEDTLHVVAKQQLAASDATMREYHA